MPGSCWQRATSGMYVWDVVQLADAINIVEVQSEANRDAFHTKHVPWEEMREKRLRAKE